MLKQLTSVLCFFLLLADAQAQTFQVSGTVLDATSKTPLIGATITLTGLRDTTQKHYTAVDVNGRFVIGELTARGFMMKISYIGYDDLTQRIILQNPAEDLGELLLTPSTKMLKEVEIVGKTPIGVQKGDTTELNANTVKTTRDATAEELLKKMPGMTTEGGTVKAQGENVTKVTIDGREYFGEDASMALRNLPAEIVDKVQVFDGQSDQSRFSGVNDGNTSKMLNIVTKADKRNGQFGKVYAGYGTDERYQAGFNLNLFKGARRISLLGMSNNINQQNFATQDLLGVTSGQQGGGFGGGRMGGGRMMMGGGNFGGGNNNFLVGNQSGITTTHSFGANYSNMWGKKVNVVASYFFNASSNANNQALNRTYFIGNTSNQVYSQNSNSVSDNMNHRFNMRFEYKIDSMNLLLITPRFGFQSNTSQSDLLAVNSLQERILPLSETRNNTNRRTSGFNFNNDLLFQHAFKKRGRTFSVNVGTQVNNREWTNDLGARNIYYRTDGTETDSLNQRSTRPTDSYTLSSNLMYTEPLGKNSRLLFNYTVSYNHNFSEKRTWNRDEVAQRYSLLDTGLSNTFNNDYLTNRGQVMYNLNKDKKMNFGAGLSFQNAQLDSRQSFPVDNTTQRSFNNILPLLMLRYNFSENTNLRMFYRTSTNAPSVAQLQNVIDNANPLLLSTGNPSLKQEFSHFGVIRYSRNNPAKATSFFVVMNASKTQNYIGTSTIIARRDTALTDEITLNRGSQLVVPVNLDGNWSAFSFINYGLPIKKLKVTLNASTAFSYRRTPGLINNALNISNSYNIAPSLVISSNISDKVDFSLSTTGNFNIVENTIQPQLNNNFYYQLTSFRSNVIWKGFVLQNELNHTWYTGLAEGFDQNFLLWNLSFGKKMFKDQAGELKVTVFDLLKQNNSISRTVTESYIEDVRTRVLQQYVMLTFTYNIRHFQQPKK